MPPWKSQEEFVAQTWTAWQQSLVVAAHDLNFKNGAFKNSITANTPAFEAADIMLESGLLSAEEKGILLEGREAFQKCRDRGAHLTPADVVDLADPIMKMSDMFVADRKAQGYYVPPLTAYSVGKDNKVTRTFEITDEGCKVTEGGSIGEVPGAPEEFNRQEREHFKKLDLEFGPESPRHTIMSRTSHAEAGVPNKADTNVPAGESKSSQADSDFGGAFEKSLRGAFSK